MWLMSLTATALLIAALEGVCPEGAVKRIVRLISGMVMLLMILKPVWEVGGFDWFSVSEYESAAQQTVAQAEEERENMVKTIIEERTEAYIVDKAAQLGAACLADVKYRSTENGVYLPTEVTVTGDIVPQIQEELSLLIERELGVARDAQSFDREGG